MVSAGDNEKRSKGKGDSSMADSKSIKSHSIPSFTIKWRISLFAFADVGWKGF